MEELYLKNNVVAEPVINNWYAHLLLIPPSTFSMTLVNRHIRLLESFLEEPSAYNNLFGNNDLFLNLNDLTKNIHDIYNKTTTQLSSLIDLNNSIVELVKLLESSTGETLEPLYQKIPDALRGYVELFYDLQNNARFRFIEPLLYTSKYYKAELQSVHLSIYEKDNRPFSLNIPRVISKDTIEINKNFSSTFYDELFSLRTKPKSKKHIAGLFESVGINFEKVHHLFSQTPPQKHNHPSLSKHKFSIKYLGHACILIETSDFSILIDPLISYRPKHGIDRFTYDDLPESIDYLLITHSHMDHVVIEHLLQLRYKVKNVVVPYNNSAAIEDPSLKLIFRALGFKNIYSLDILDSISLPNSEIKAIPFLGEHGDLDIFSKTTYFISIHGYTFLFAVDSNNIQNEHGVKS